MGKKEMTEAQKMMEALKQFNKPMLHKIEGLQEFGFEFDLYVKTFSTRDFRDLMAKGDEFDSKYDDGYNAERCAALELFDAEGNQVFDPSDLQQMEMLSKLPFALRRLMTDASAKANHYESLKNLLATGNGL